MPSRPASNLSRFLLTAAAFACLTSSAMALPLTTDATVASGSVSFAASGSELTVTQTTDTSIINWSSFSLGAGESLSFLQPQSSSMTLLRLTGSSPVTLSGTLSSFGGLYIVATSGFFLDALTINASTLWITDTDIADADFLAGNFGFPPATPIDNGGAPGVTGNITVTDVPEPASYTMLLAALGILAVTSLRRVG